MSASARMPAVTDNSQPPGLGARLHHRLATHLPVAPFNATSDRPAVSFTFDDVPVSAVTLGADMMEEAGARATYYVAGGLLGLRDRHWQVMDAAQLLDMHLRGHEIACHSHSHIRADRMTGAQILADIERNHTLLRAIEPSLPLENFAYPYGQASLAWKLRLKNRFRSSRSIWPRLNHGPTDAQYLHSIALVDREIDEGGIDRAFDEAVRRKGWLIFYSHDVADSPSDYGCSPRLLRHALKAAERSGVGIETVKAALDRITGRAA